MPKSKIRNFPEFFLWNAEDLATLMLMIHDASSLLHCKYDQLHHKLNQNNDTQVQQNGIVNDRKRMKTVENGYRYDNRLRYTEKRRKTTPGFSRFRQDFSRFVAVSGRIRRRFRRSEWTSWARC